MPKKKAPPPRMTVAIPYGGTAKDAEWKRLEFPDAEIEYKVWAQNAPTGRARCRVCGTNIDKGDIRLGFPKAWRGTEFGFINCWQHTICSRMPEGEEIKLEHIYNYNEIHPTERKTILTELHKTDPPDHLDTIDPDDPEFLKKAELPRVKAPDDIVMNLLPYQEEGYGWMSKAEESETKGGILADEMGMGKTLQMITTIVGRNKELDGKGKGQTRMPTLVVTPTSAVAQWAEEIERYTKSGTLKVLLYYQNRQSLSLEDINSYDIVLSTYPVLEYEYRSIVNRHKITCQYCSKKMLARSLVPHQKYFCGPFAQLTAKLSKTERGNNKKAGMAKSMQTLGIDGGDEMLAEALAADEVSEAGGKGKKRRGGKGGKGGSSSKKRRTKRPGDSGGTVLGLGSIYRDIMHQAGREPVPMYAPGRRGGGAGGLDIKAIVRNVKGEGDSEGEGSDMQTETESEGELGTGMGKGKEKKQASKKRTAAKKSTMTKKTATKKTKMTTTTKKKKKKKDPDAPKRASSAYNYFSSAMRKELKTERPELPNAEVMKVLGERWKALDEQGRVPFAAMAKKDKERYDMEMQSYTPPPESESESEGESGKEAGEEASERGALITPHKSSVGKANDSKGNGSGNGNGNDDSDFEPLDTGCSPSNGTMANGGGAAGGGDGTLLTVNGDLLSCNEQYIAHQTNCRTKGGKGLSSELFKRFPHANVYEQSNKRHRRAGTIQTRGGDTGRDRGVIAMYAQDSPGSTKSARTRETAAERQQWFQQCLGHIEQLPGLRSIAFPHKIACGLGGGSWAWYERALRDFAQRLPQVRVVVYKQGGGGRGGKGGAKKKAKGKAKADVKAEVQVEVQVTDLDSGSGDDHAVVGAVVSTAIPAPTTPSASASASVSSFGQWVCERCTFNNPAGSSVCSMCDTPRKAKSDADVKPKAAKARAWGGLKEKVKAASAEGTVGSSSSSNSSSSGGGSSSRAPELCLSAAMVEYTAATVSRLTALAQGSPQQLVPADACLFFWGHTEAKCGWKACMSNWFPASFTSTEEESETALQFHNSEQYMMWRKALLFGDHATAAQILRTPPGASSPSKVKALGRKVKGFMPEVWATSALAVVTRGCYLKFGQNPTLRTRLLNTGNTVLVEASPQDAIWGIGLHEAQARRTDPLQWPGKNLLGECLMRARTRLRHELQHATTAGAGSSSSSSGGVVKTETTSNGDGIGDCDGGSGGGSGRSSRSSSRSRAAAMEGAMRRRLARSPIKEQAEADSGGSDGDDAEDGAGAEAGAASDASTKPGKLVMPMEGKVWGETEAEAEAEVGAETQVHVKGELGMGVEANSSADSDGKGGSKGARQSPPERKSPRERKSVNYNEEDDRDSDGSEAGGAPKTKQAGNSRQKPPMSAKLAVLVSSDSDEAYTEADAKEDEASASSGSSDSDFVEIVETPKSRSSSSSSNSSNSSNNSNRKSSGGGGRLIDDINNFIVNGSDDEVAFLGDNSSEMDSSAISLSKRIAAWKASSDSPDIMVHPMVLEAKRIEDAQTALKARQKAASKRQKTKRAPTAGKSKTKGKTKCGKLGRGVNIKLGRQDPGAGAGGRQIVKPKRKKAAGESESESKSEDDDSDSDSDFEDSTKGKTKNSNKSKAMSGADGEADDDDNGETVTMRLTVPISSVESPSSAPTKGKGNGSTGKRKRGRPKKGGGDGSSDDDDDNHSGRAGSSKSSGKREYALKGEKVDTDGIDLMYSALHCVQWRRIVLDEAHKIKSRTNSTAKSVYALNAQYKWCLTGTPLQNRVGEMYSLLRFLEIQPHSCYFCRRKGCDCKSFSWNFGRESRKCAQCGHPPMQHFSYFNKHIVNPIKKFGNVGEGKKAFVMLRDDVLAKCMLRRTKVERAADIQLPPLNVQIRKIKLEPAERDFYDGLSKNTKAQYSTYVDKGTIMHNFAHIFELLSRLRQALNHPYLVIHGSGATGNLSYNTRSALPGGSDVCGVCGLDILRPSDLALSGCKHTFHRDCISEYVEHENAVRAEAEAEAKAEAEAEAAKAKGKGKGKSKGKAGAKDFTAWGGDLNLQSGGDTPKAKSKGKAKGKAKGKGKHGDDELEDAVTCPVCFLPLTVNLAIRGGDDSDQDDQIHAASPTACAAAASGGGEEEEPEGDSGGLTCVVCFERPRDALLVPCGHMYTCMECTKEWGRQSELGRACPVCREPVTKVVRATNDSAANSKGKGKGKAKSAGVKLGRKSILQRIDMDEFASSSKVEALVQAATEMRAKGEKGIVFSQYTSMLDVCEWRLNRVGVKTVKLMGHMPVSERKSVLHAFKTEPSIDMILMSLKAGGEGLNLQEASYVFVLEPWWNPSVENQAIQRAHRIGQTRSVTAVRFITEGTLEMQMLKLQEKKQLVCDGTIDGKAAALAKLTAEDIRFLFQN